jgi:CheY-like chemotaxis protein
VVRGALATLQAGLPGTLEFSVELDESIAAVHVDPAQVEQVLLNLCINARDATRGVGRVRLGVRPVQITGVHCAGCRQPIDGAFVELYVDDNGHGMTPEVLERIFEPFYSTKETGKGSGMGLAMVHGIVHEHGGHVVVESRPGEGTRFRILLPALPGQVAQADASEANPPARLPRPAMKGSVLVVDDEEMVGEFMRELLATWGLEATCVHRPEAALDLVHAEPDRFDVVITDQSMPRLTGLELARRLKQVRATLPVVLYTGHGDGISGDEVDAAGVAVVMHKPVDPAQLSQVLTRCLAAAGGPV